jgi:hypothetical protein
MNGRFRFLASDGRELELAATDDLVRCVRSGKIHADTLLYDAEGGGWAPARHHSVFLSALKPALVTTPRPTGGQEHRVEARQRSREASAKTVEMPQVGYSFHEPEPVAAEDAVAQMIRERDDVLIRDERAAGAGVVALESQAREWTRWVSNEALAHPTAESEAPLPWHQPKAFDVPTAPARRPRGGGLFVPLVAGAVGLASLAIIMTRDSGPSLVRDSATTNLPTSRPAAGRGLLGSSLPHVTPGDDTPSEQAAFNSMLEEMRALESRYGVDQVPAVWLEGRYLADANHYPEVVRYWLKYDDYVREMQAREGDLFHANLMRELEAEGLSGSVLSLRLASGTRSFQAGSPRRDSVYAAMLELSHASVALHTLLVEHASQISYEPSGTATSRNPVLEAVAETDELNREMQQSLSAVLSAMERAYGSRVGSKDELPLALRRGLQLDESP